MLKYKLIVLCGKAGTGKNTILNLVYKNNKKNLNLITVDTTRPPREGEVNSVDYNFLTKQDFLLKQHITLNVFNNWYYGIPEEALKKDKINICILSPNGIKQLYERDDLKIKLFLISTDDKTRLLRQINRELYPNINEICRRFLADEEDFIDLYKYPFYKLRNMIKSDLDQCVAIIEKTIEELLKDDLDKME